MDYLRLPPGISIYHNQDTDNQKNISRMNEHCILSQASHKGADSHNHGANQRAEFISVHLIYPRFCFFCQMSGSTLPAYGHKPRIDNRPKDDSV